MASGSPVCFMQLVLISSIIYCMNRGRCHGRPMRWPSCNSKHLVTPGSWMFRAIFGEENDSRVRKGFLTPALAPSPSQDSSLINT